MLLYNPSTLGTSTNQITFNDDSAAPYYRLTSERIIGRDITQNDVKIPDGMGVVDFQTLMGKVNYVLEGIMYPDDEASYDTGQLALRKLANLSIEQADTDADGGYVAFTFTEYDGYDKQLSVKLLYVDMPRRTKNGLKQPFRLFGKLKYPVLEAQTASSAVIGSSTATTSGSSNLPWVLPKVVGKTSYSSNGSLTNHGNLDAWPTSITITGPITTPRITNSTSGEYIELTGLVLGATSDSVVITYDQDTLTIAQAGVNKLNLLTSGSTLFKVKPGINSFTLTGSTVGSGATATVTARSTWAL